MRPLRPADWVGAFERRTRPLLMDDAPSLRASSGFRLSGCSQKDAFREPVALPSFAWEAGEQPFAYQFAPMSRLVRGGFCRRVRSLKVAVIPWEICLDRHYRELSLSLSLMENTSWSVEGWRWRCL